MPYTLNHHHLLYFWVTANEGSIAAASKVLNLTPQTISAQLKLLEDGLDVSLFEREGRGLRLTDVGQIAKGYADEIFGLSRELQATLRGKPQTRTREFRVGVSDALPKLVCQHLLEPALSMEDPFRMVCREDGVNALLGELALHHLDLVLNDAPIPPGLNVRAYNHLLGQCGIVWMGANKLARRFKSKFPLGLEDAPFILPTDGTALRRSLDTWFAERGIRPRIIAEIADNALMKAFGARGLGIVPVADVAAKEVHQQYKMSSIGPVDGVTERFFAISIERRIRHPAVAAIREHAKDTLYS